MTVYSFFLKVSEEDVMNKTYKFLEDYKHCLKETYNGLHPVKKTSDGNYLILYAITTNKAAKTLFQMTRDPNIFTLYKQDIDKDKWKRMKTQLTDAFIREEVLTDVSESESGYKEDKVSLVMTNYEYELVNDENGIILSIHDYIYEEELKKNESETPLIPVELFTKSVHKALVFTGYRYIIPLVQDNCGANNGDDPEYMETEFNIDLRNFFDKFQVKTFPLFVYLFGNTLRKDCLN